MLVLTRRIDETIVIDGNIQVTILSIRGQQVRLGITAPLSVPVARQELLAKYAAENGSPPTSREDAHSRRLYASSEVTR